MRITLSIPEAVQFLIFLDTQLEEEVALKALTTTIEKALSSQDSDVLDAESNEQIEAQAVEHVIEQIENQEEAEIQGEFISFETDEDQEFAIMGLATA